MRVQAGIGLAALGLVLAAGVTGCGTPGAPMPPSLNLPDRVMDLTAVRTGNQVTLAWTMPKKNTDKLLLNDKVPVTVCRKEGTAECVATVGASGTTLEIAPGAAGSFAESLPAELVTGSPRALSYFVELKNRNGRSAGLSNAAIILAGDAPAPVGELTAELRNQGVVLGWASNGVATAVRLHRKLLTPPADKPKEGLLAPPPEPLEQNLLVEPGNGNHALDSSIRVGLSYEYRAQRVARITVGSQALELAGELSAPVRIEAVDIFPPAVPTGLAAVAAAGENGAAASIDLSWQPAIENDLAGYIVYRREGDAPWQRISPAPPQPVPAFRDAKVQPGHSYRYAVSAIDQGGHESARSAETEETVPNP